MDFLQILLIVLAVVGALVAAILGWLGSGEPFASRKFFSSILRAVFAGVMAGISYQYVGTVTAMVLAGAFLAGAGIDVLGNRLAGAITSTGPTTTSPPK